VHAHEYETPNSCEQSAGAFVLLSAGGQIVTQSPGVSDRCIVPIP
jgi:hypothetical protein